MVGCPSVGLVRARQTRHRLCLLTARDLSTHVKTFDLVLVLLMEK